MLDSVVVSPDFCSDAPSHTSAANHRRSTKHPTVVASAARRCLNPWWMGKKVQGSSKGKSHCCISSRLFNTIQSTWIKTWVSALFRIEFVKICSNYLKFPKWFFWCSPLWPNPRALGSLRTLRPVSSRVSGSCSGVISFAAMTSWQKNLDFTRISGGFPWNNWRFIGGLLDVYWRLIGGLGLLMFLDMRLIEWLYQINLMWMLATWCEWSSRHDQHDEINKMKTGNPKDFTVEIKQHHLMMWFPKLNSGAPDSGRRCHAVLAIRSNTSPTLTTASVCLPPRLSSALRYSAELQCWATVLQCYDSYEIWETDPSPRPSARGTWSRQDFSSAWRSLGFYLDHLDHWAFHGTEILGKLKQVRIQDLFLALPAEHLSASVRCRLLQNSRNLLKPNSGTFVCFPPNLLYPTSTHFDTFCPGWSHFKLRKLLEVSPQPQ